MSDSQDPEELAKDEASTVEPVDDRKPGFWTGYMKLQEGLRARSKRLLGLTWGLVMQDRRLLVFPTISAISALGFGVLVFALTPDHGVSSSGNSHAYLLPMIIASAPVTFVTISCGVATASMVNDLLDGNDPSPRRALSLLRRRLGTISQGDARLVKAAWSQHAQLRFNL